MRPSGSVSAEGLPSVIMTICFMSLFWRAQNALGEAQAFARVGVVRADLDARELRERDLFGGVVEEDER